MKKLAVFGLILGVVCGGILLARKRQTFETSHERDERQQKKRSAMFEKMKEGMDAMPEDFPPVVMFNNVAAARENSERILELLEKDPSEAEVLVDSAAK